MRVIDYNLIPDGSKTKTMQDLGQVMGQKPHMSKAIVTLFPELTLQKLTEQLGQVFHKDVKDLKEIDSFSFEWMVKTNQIPRIRIAEDCSDTGEGGAEISLILEKKYYDPHDAFELENEQVLFMKKPAQRLASNKWLHTVELVGGNLGRRINTAYLTRGRTTKYVTNYFPELSERGYSKLMHNVEKHVNYISRHRVGDSASGDFRKLSPKYLEHAGAYFQMPTMDLDLMEQIYLAFENSMLLGPGNFDDKGNVLITMEDGRPIPVGEGLIPQAKRFCGQQRYSGFTEKVLRSAIDDVVGKKKNKTGNKIVMICNWRQYQQAQELLDSLLKARVTDNYFYTSTGGKIKVGAEYNAYEFAGNTITFMENAALTERYPEKGYGIFIDMDKHDGEPNIQMHTITGMSLFSGDLKGMGGKGGGDSGDISTLVHAYRKEYMGYRGIKLANPYSAHILEENILW
jgi:hypothetical protein